MFEKCRCGSDRVASVSAKCSDLCNVRIKGVDHDGYVPEAMGIGCGDYIEFAWCLDCGRIQSDDSSDVEFPLPVCDLEKPEHERGTSP